MSNIVNERSDDKSRHNQKMPHRKKKSPFLAIILSLFIPGLGNVYTGQVNLGIATFVGFIIGVIIISFSHGMEHFTLFSIFLLCTIVLWLTSMAVAYGTAVKINDGEYIHDIAFFPKKHVSKP